MIPQRGAKHSEELAILVTRSRGPEPKKRTYVGLDTEEVWV